MTKREMFEQVITIVNASEVENRDELIEKLNHEVELLNKKSSASRKPSKTQIENEEFKSQIVEFLTATDRPVRIKEIQEGIASLAEISNQRITHILTAMVKAGTIEKEYEKRVPYYSVK